MSWKITLSFDEQNYQNNTPVSGSFSLDSGQTELAIALISLGLHREIWLEMSDNDWNTLESRISELIGVFT